MTSSNNFSTLERNKQIEKLSNTQFDILIFGGGITGSGVALDAASRRLSVAIIDKNDFASGTSSKSTKLIHGGFRYLLQKQFSFVAKLGKERRIIRKISQNNVIPTPIILPIYKGEKLNRFYTYWILKLYQIITKTPKEFQLHKITKKELTEKYKHLNTNGLKRAFLYYEFKTKDGRLVLETIKKSAELGAICLNYAEPTKLIKHKNKLKGAELHDLISNKQFSIKSKLIINATGVWCNDFVQKFNLKLPKNLLTTKGIHLCFTKEKLPIKEAFHIITHDKRMIFIVPRQNFVYVGTTDTIYMGNYWNPDVEQQDVDYLLKAINNKFPTLNIKENDVISCWAGVRSLIQRKTSTTSEIRRNDALFLGDYGLLTITGGKLTNYRLMAKKVIDNALVFLQKKHIKCDTQNIPLSGNIGDKILSSTEIVEKADYAFDEAKQTGISVENFKNLFYRYGSNINIITEKAYEFRNSELTPEQVWLKAELWYAVNYEMLIKLYDFVSHRTEMVLFDKEKINKNIKFMADELGNFLSWDNYKKTSEIKDCKENLKLYTIR